MIKYFDEVGDLQWDAVIPGAPWDVETTTDGSRVYAASYYNETGSATRDSEVILQAFDSIGTQLWSRSLVFHSSDAGQYC
jgi:hypothetical protein